MKNNTIDLRAILMAEQERKRKAKRFLPQKIQFKSQKPKYMYSKTVNGRTLETNHPFLAWLEQIWRAMFISNKFYR